MAKFVVISKQAFTDLVRAFGKKGTNKPGIAEDVRSGLRFHNINRDTIRRHYKAVQGREVPNDRVVLDKTFFSKLKAAVGAKKLAQSGVMKSKHGSKTVHPDFESGGEYLRQRQSEEGY